MRRWAGVASALGMVIVFPMLSARAQGDDVGVEIHDNYYAPEEIHVAEGATVTWTNLGGAHSVTSGDNGFSFDSSPSCVAGLNCMATGDTFSHQFLVPERVTYHCRVHGNAMVGTVIVDPASRTTTTTPSTTTTTTLVTTTTTTSSSDASAPPASASAPPTQLSQQPLPSLPSGPGSAALPKAIARSARSESDDERPWALLAVAMAGGTTLAGVVLVRRGRVPFG